MMGPGDVTEQQSRRDRAIASALRRADDHLGTSLFCGAYLLTSDRRALVAVMMVDTPLSFAMPSSFDTDDLRWPQVRAYRSQKVVTLTRQDFEDGVAGILPSSVPLVSPYLDPFMSAHVPIRTPRRDYGVLTARWTAVRTPAEEDLDFLRSVAYELAVELEESERNEGDVKVPAVPVFIPSRPQLPTGDPEGGQALLDETAATAAAHSGYLHQLQRLATDLVSAVRLEDILAVAQKWVVRPFGGKGIAVCSIEKDHLHVVAAAGFPRDVVHDMEGAPLAAHRPETEALTRLTARIFPSTADLEREYPEVHNAWERRAIGYFPLLRNGQAVGCCVVEFSEVEESKSLAELALLTLMLEQVGQAIERARATEIEHALARSIQRSLLPRSFPHIPEVVATARYVPVTGGADVGGDWYDVLALPEGRIGFVIGDVEGHNLDAAAAMGQLRSAVRAYAAEGHEPAEVLERSNELLIELKTELYATCCCMWIDVSTGTATVASAGHPGPLISHETGGVTQLKLPTGPALGVETAATYQERTVDLGIDSLVSLFTDGVLAPQAQGDESAVEKLCRVLADRGDDDIEVLADRMINDGHDGQGFDDDAALLLARYEGVRRREPTGVARMSVHRGDLHGVAGVRRFLSELLSDWGLESVLDDIEVMASEVVTNALIHAHSEVDLRLRKRDGQLRVEVQDSDPSPPVPTTLLEDDVGNEEAESGRGLLIVGALARDWGSSAAGRGKITWFELGVPDDTGATPTM